MQQNFLSSNRPDTAPFGPCFRCWSHDGGHGNMGHDDMHKEMAIGMPGKGQTPSDRTIEVTMRETDDAR